MLSSPPTQHPPAGEAATAKPPRQPRSPALLPSAGQPPDSLLLDSPPAVLPGASSAVLPALPPTPPPSTSQPARRTPNSPRSRPLPPTDTTSPLPPPVFALPATASVATPSQQQQLQKPQLPRPRHPLPHAALLPPPTGSPTKTPLPLSQVLPLPPSSSRQLTPSSLLSLPGSRLVTPTTGSSALVSPSALYAGWQTPQHLNSSTSNTTEQSFSSRLAAKNPGLVHVFGQDPLATPFSSHNRSYVVRDEPPRKRFQDHVFYLDVEDERLATSLKGPIIQMGGIIDAFFSKKITHLISTRAQRVAEISVTVSPHPHLQQQQQHHGRPGSLGRPEVSPVGHDASHAPGDSARRNVDSLLDMLPSGGQRKPQLPLPRAKPTTKLPSAPYGTPNENDVLVQAKKFNIKIWSVDKLRANITKYLSPPEQSTADHQQSQQQKQAQQQQLAQQLQQKGPLPAAAQQAAPVEPPPTAFVLQYPTVVVEDATGMFRPVFKEYPPARKGRTTFPSMNFDAPAGICPFYPQHILDDKKLQRVKVHREAEIRRKAEEHQSFLALTDEHKLILARKKGPKEGYCECCRVEYQDVNKHAASVQHLRFATNDDNYAAVDQLFQLARTRDMQNGFTLPFLYPAEPLPERPVPVPELPARVEPAVPPALPAVVPAQPLELPVVEVVAPPAMVAEREKLSPPPTLPEGVRTRKRKLASPEAVSAPVAPVEATMVVAEEPVNAPRKSGRVTTRASWANAAAHAGQPSAPTPQLPSPAPEEPELPPAKRPRPAKRRSVRPGDEVVGEPPKAEPSSEAAAQREPTPAATVEPLESVEPFRVLRSRRILWAPPPSMMPTAAVTEAPVVPVVLPQRTSASARPPSVANLTSTVDIEGYTDPSATHSDPHCVPSSSAPAVPAAPPVADPRPQPVPAAAEAVSSSAPVPLSTKEAQARRLFAGKLPADTASTTLQRKLQLLAVAKTHAPQFRSTMPNLHRTIQRSPIQRSPIQRSPAKKKEGLGEVHHTLRVSDLGNLDAVDVRDTLPLGRDEREPRSSSSASNLLGEERQPLHSDSSQRTHSPAIQRILPARSIRAGPFGSPGLPSGTSAVSMTTSPDGRLFASRGPSSSPVRTPARPYLSSRMLATPPVNAIVLLKDGWQFEASDVTKKADDKSPTKAGAKHLLSRAELPTALTFTPEENDRPFSLDPQETLRSAKALVSADTPPSEKDEDANAPDHLVILREKKRPDPADTGSAEEGS